MIKKVMCVGLAWLGLSAGASAQTTIVEYIHTDALGSPVATTDVSGNVIDRQVYDSYGQSTTETPSDSPGFTGHVRDSATELSFMQQRYYDPEVGRFLSVDPIGASSSGRATFNRYWYATGNPYAFKDPDGRSVVCTSTSCHISCVSVIECTVDFAYVEQVKDQQRNIAAFQLINALVDSLLSEGGQRGSKTPNKGEPGTVHVNPGSGQERLYGEDGLPELDVDHDHDHGQGRPHEHPWTRNSEGRPVRGDGRPVPRPSSGTSQGESRESSGAGGGPVAPPGTGRIRREAPTGSHIKR